MKNGKYRSMADRNRITQKNPRTGALPSEQTAESQNDTGLASSSSIPMTESDKLIYKLVENNVSYAQTQFHENLEFNQETLTNVLYDNIKEILSSEFDEGEFVNWIVDQLLERGCVVKTTEPDTETPAAATEPVSQSNQEVVYELDTQAYDDLRQSVGQAIEILKANKLNFLKLMADVDGKVTDLGDLDKKQERDEKELYERRDREITSILEKIKGNQKVLDEHVGTQVKTHKIFDSIVKRISKKSDANALSAKGLKDKNTKLKKGIMDSIGGIQRKQDEFERVTKKGWFSKFVDSIKRDKVKKRREAGKMGLKDKRAQKFFGKKVGGQVVAKKPSLKRRMAYRMAQLRRKISNSVVGKAYRAVKSAVGFAANVVRSTYHGVKAAGQAFIGASRIVGKGVVAGAKGLFGFMKSQFIKASTVNIGGKGAGGAGKGASAGSASSAAASKSASSQSTLNAAKAGNINSSISEVKKQANATFDFAPAQIVTVIGWRALKFAVKKLWKGIKKLTVKVGEILLRLFKLGGKFANKVSSFAAILGKGIKDKAYKFLVKPLATMMVTVFGFVKGVVMSPINFMKWAIPNTLERLRDALHNVKEGTADVLKSTRSFFNKLMRNPLTWIIVIGGIFLIFRQQIFSWFGKKIGSIRKNLVPFLVSAAQSIWSFIKNVGMVIFTVGKFLFDAIEYITNPKNWIAQTVWHIIKAVMWAKSQIISLVTATHKDTVDALCMFLAGDMIGLAIHAIGGAVVKMWRWMKTIPLFRMIFGIVRGYLAAYQLVFTMSVTLGKSISNAISKLIHGEWGGIVDSFTKPWKKWWASTKKLWNGVFNAFSKPGEYVYDDPVEDVDDISAETSASVKALHMKGIPQESIKYWERYEREILKQQGGASLLARIHKMEDLYKNNASMVREYDKFIKGVWELGKGNDEFAARTTRILLESPALSEKLLSALYYYNPQTGKVMSLRPESYVQKFIRNIQELMLNPERNDLDVFSTIVQAFDQLNKERALYVNNQGQKIGEFAEKLSKYSEKFSTIEQTVEMRDLFRKFTEGDLFDNMKVWQSFDQFQNGDSRTADVKSVTGKTFGDNVLFETGHGKVRHSEAYEVTPKKPDEDDDQDARSKSIENVLLPEQMVPPPPEPKMENGETRSMREKWEEHIQLRNKGFQDGMTEKELMDAGLEKLTFDEFKQKYQREHPPTEEELQEAKERKEKNIKSIRLVKDIQAFNAQGVTASIEGFKLGGNGTILNIEADGLEQDMYMFSPEWQRVQGLAKISDAEIMLMVDSQDKKAQEQVKKAREQARIEEQRKKDDELRRKRREQSILDYSAKVNGGFIEVKVGEDVVAMEEAWAAHIAKRNEGFERGLTEAQLQKMGLRQYTWEEWQKYYRKMHGLPEDGIKRIPFEGKKKERIVDWSKRPAYSIDELAKFGVTVSQEGPVMIPMDKAMEMANAFIKGATTIHSIRDGLEMMRIGLDGETKRLQKERGEGEPVTVVSNTEAGPAPTQTVPPLTGTPDSSQQQE